MDPREELIALRRLAELEEKAASAKPPTPAVQEDDRPYSPANIRKGVVSDVRGFISGIPAAIEGAGAIVGGVIGAPLGPAGVVGGAGLGYGIAKGGVRMTNQLLGNEPAPSSVGNVLATGAHDVLTGATYEAGGRVAMPMLAKGAGWVADKFGGQWGKLRASTIAKEALGPDLEAARRTLTGSADGLTASQATADIYSPTWQALNKRAATIDPRFYGDGPLTPAQMTEATNALQSIAGGATQTQMKTARAGARDALNARLVPTLKTELQAANTAGEMLPKLEGQANRFGAAAASKAEDVRRFTAAGDRAAGRAHTTVLDKSGKPVAAVTVVPGYPRQPGRYTYMGELEKAADDVAEQAANASLPFGEAARFAKAAADSLAAHGLKPLRPEAIQGGIQKVLKNPDFAGNAEIEDIMRAVGSDIAQWTKHNGIIDARALDSIRKNSINGAILRLYKPATVEAQKELAAKVTGNITPLIVDAMEAAGGTGYRNYLADYAVGRQFIDQQKMGAVLADQLRTAPKAFVETATGNNPDAVRKVFGPGRYDKEADRFIPGYDLAQQMSGSDMGKIGTVADKARRGISAGEQATAGQNALRTILEEHDPRFLKIPWGLSPKTMAINRALDVAEKRLGKSTMNALAQGIKTAQSAQELLAMLPAKERVQVLKRLAEGGLLPPGAAAASVNALAPSN